MAFDVITNSTVVECDKLKQMTCWVSAVEVDVMTLIFQSPKLSVETAHEKQKVVACDKITVMVAKHMLELVKLGAPTVTRH